MKERPVLKYDLTSLGMLSNSTLGTITDRERSHLNLNHSTGNLYPKSTRNQMPQKNLLSIETEKYQRRPADYTDRQLIAAAADSNKSDRRSSAGKRSGSRNKSSPLFGELADQLKSNLRLIKYPSNIRSKDLVQGKAAVYVQILEYFLLKFSPTISSFFKQEVQHQQRSSNRDYDPQIDKGIS